MKSTAANIEKKAERWSLSWHPDARWDSFTKEAILAGVPPTSGVYGLYNFDYQVFIGESANIQEALLRHERETDFQSRHLQPTGCIFEPCAAKLRKPKADALIARFHPVLQTEAALTETCSPSNGPMASEVGLDSQELETSADQQEFPVREHEKLPNVGRRFHIRRTHGTELAAMFVVFTVAIFCLGIPAVNDIQTQVYGADRISLARISATQSPASDRAEIGLRPQNEPSTNMADRFANQSAEPTPAKPDVHASASTPNDVARIAAKSASATDRAVVQALVEPVKTSPPLSKKWSVQVSAVPAKDIADTLAQRLKANGFDGYVVQAAVKGQTYYRVRVGHFEAREEAESVRQSLARQEGYRDAYLTAD
jgi:cell division septation protein DedD